MANVVFCLTFLFCVFAVRANKFMIKLAKYSLAYNMYIES
jgi:hypothetical protein